VDNHISGSVIFCDDVREEIGLRRTFIGVCGPYLAIPKLPTLLPKFCVVTTLICHHGRFPKSFAVRVTYGTDEIQKIELTPKELLEWENDVEPMLATEVDEFPENDPPKARLTVELAISPFVIRNEGRLAAHIDTDQGTVRVGSLQISVDPDIEGQSQEAGMSRPVISRSPMPQTVEHSE